jgi:hypothetical protein
LNGLDESHHTSAGDGDPAVAAAVSLAVDDVMVLANTSIDLIDQADSTSVSIENKSVNCSSLHQNNVNI